MKAPSSRVLRAAGVPVLLAQLEEHEPGRWRPVVTEADDDTPGEYVTERLHLRFTVNTVLAIEEQYDGATGFEQALADDPVRVVRYCMAQALKLSEEHVGERMIPGQLPLYQNAVEVAWALAVGADPTTAARIFAAGIKLAIKGEQLSKLEFETYATKLEEEAEKPADQSTGSLSPDGSATGDGEASTP